MKSNKRFWALSMAGALAVSNLSAIATPFGGLTALAAYPLEDEITWTVDDNAELEATKGMAFTTKAVFDNPLEGDEQVRVIVSDKGTTSFTDGDVFIPSNTYNETDQSISKENNSSKYGTVTLQAQAVSDGNPEIWNDIEGATAEIKINPAEVKVTEKNYSMEPEGEVFAGDTVQLYAFFDKGKVSATNVDWSIADTYAAKAEVDENGLVTAKAATEANTPVVIKATPKDYPSATPGVFELTINASTFEVAIGDYDPDAFYVGDEVALVATYGSKTVTSESTLSSSNNNVATIAADGTIKAISEGEVTITAKYKSNQVKKTVTVKEAPAEEYVIVAEGDDFTVLEGKKIQLSVEKSGVPVSSEITWTSASEAKATVDENGLVTGVAAGTSEIKAEFTIDEVTYSPTETVTVKAAEWELTEDGNHDLDEGEDNTHWTATMIAGDKMKVTPEYGEEVVTGTWSLATGASNKVRVDKDGTITALEATEQQNPATVKFTDADDNVVEIAITVTEEELTLDSDESEVEEGSSLQLTAKYGVEDVTNDDYIKYESSNTSIATVDTKGLVNGIKEGNVTINATYTLNGHDYTADINLDIVAITDTTKAALEAAEAANAAAQDANVAADNANDAAKAVKNNPTAENIADARTMARLAEQAAATAKEKADVATKAAEATDNASAKQAAEAAAELAKTAEGEARTAASAAKDAAQAAEDKMSKEEAIAAANAAADKAVKDPTDANIQAAKDAVKKAEEKGATAADLKSANDKIAQAEAAKEAADKAADGSAKDTPASVGTELVDANGNKTGFKVTNADPKNPEAEYEGPADKNATKADIPETTTDLSGNTYKVTGIVANAFKDTKVKTVTIRKNIKKIDPKAFNKSKVKNVKIKGTKLTKKMAKSFKKVKKGGWLKVSGKHKAKNKEILNNLPNVKNGKTKVK